jgi:hypothetical protein
VASGSQRWILGPRQDAAFVLATPIAILAVVTAARATGWIDALVTLGIALAMAHYLPGMLRAYGDPALFRRFRVRLCLAPIALFSASAAFAWYNLHAVLVVALFWGAWHWAMQIYGFARIYDARAGSVDPVTARLDKVLCLLWFGACVYVLNDGLRPYVANIYRSGVPLLPETSMEGFRTAWLGATAITTLLYAIHTLRRTRAGHSPSPLKLVFLAASFSLLGFAESIDDRPLVGYVIFESWHDIQYLAFTWQFTARRTQRPPAPGPLLLLLFRPGFWRVAAYLGICLGFGALTHTHRLLEDTTAVRIALSLVAATAMLHYYLDGFIWKIREQENRETLGVAVGERGAPIEPRREAPSWLRHAALWSFFVVPATLGLALETQRGSQAETEIRRSLVDLFPRSPQAHAERAHDLAGMGRLSEAIRHFRLALSLEPDLLDARLALATIPGVPAAASMEHARQAIRIAPRDARAHHAAGLAALAAGDRTAARAHLVRASQLAPGAAKIQRLLARLRSED